MKSLWNWLAVVALFLATLAGVSDAEAEKMTVTDLSGRQITVETPLKRIVLMSSRSIHEFAAVLGDDFLAPIVGWSTDLKLMDRDSYDKFSAKYPSIADIADVGYTYKNTFSVEKLISLKPDAVFMPLWMYNSTTAERAKMEAAGIPVIVLDFWKEPLDNPPASLRLMGRLFDREARAEEISSLFEKTVGDVLARLAKADRPAPSVYVEVGNKAGREYGNTYGDMGWGAMVKRSGGDNIAEEIVERTAKIDPEYLLARNPDHIVISGSFWENSPGSVRLGYHAVEEESLRLLKGYTERSGWKTLKAVKNDNVYSIYHGFCFHIYNFVAVQALAKWFHPDLFPDLDPEKSLKDFHARFMPVEYEGVWMVKLDG